MNRLREQLQSKERHDSSSDADRGVGSDNIDNLRRAVHAKISGGNNIQRAEVRWLEDALRRTEDYYKNGPRGPATWVLTHKGNIPAGAFNGISASHGFAKSDPVYVARGFLWQKGVQVGRTSPSEGAIFGWGWQLFPAELYETLVVSPQAVRWVEAQGSLNLAVLGARPVEGGHEDSGEPLYVAQADLQGAMRPGKHGAGLPSAHIPYNGKEFLVTPYRILCYAE